MAKFDHSVNLPPVFSDNNLSILPISRGDYLISHFSTFQAFESLNREVVRASLPAHIHSLDPDNIPSEAIAINCALASGMLSDFLGEDTLLPTVSGRMGSGVFDFKIWNTATESFSAVEVANSQIEIDAAFEGLETLALIEAKRDLSDDFIIRQLYYPYRVWQERISKRVRPVFLVYSNGIFSLYEYEFKNQVEYNSLVLVRQKNYSIEDTTLELSDLLNVFESTKKFVTEPNIPFPQADSFNRIINLCELLEQNPLSREEITGEYAFDSRQTDYYSSAARYLGFVEKIGSTAEERKAHYTLTRYGKQILRLGYKQRQLALCGAILKHKVFYDVFSLYLSGNAPEKNAITHLMKQANLYQVESESTYQRRSSTISGWINWMFELIEE